MKNPDNFSLILLTSILVLLGVLILAGASAPLSFENFGNTYYYLKHQALFGLAPGLILAFLFSKISLDEIKKRSFYLLLANLVLAGLVFLPFLGGNVGGAKRWLFLPFFSFQPSEFLKLTFILYLGCWLSNRQARKTGLKRKRKAGFRLLDQTFLAFLSVVGIVSLLLMLQPDLSTLVIIVVSAALMYFSLRTPLWHNGIMLLAGILILLLLIKVAPYRSARFLVFLNPTIDPMGKGYQIKQSKIAIGSGGLFGLGLGMGKQKFGFLPQAMSDSIFAVFCEETGFLGAFILISLFLMFLWQGFYLAKQSRDSFFRLVSLGISCWIGLQAFVNIAAMVGLMPLTGIPLPFISYGGTHLIAELAGVGILLNISKHTI